MTMMPAGRPTWIEIDVQAMLHNYHLAVATVGPGVAVWPVVKADGYGVGAVAISLALQQAGVAGLCVAMTEEAMVLRRAGVTVPLVLLSSPAPGLEHLLAAHRLLPVVSTLADARRLAGFGDDQSPLAIHLKVDTGMGRLGFSMADFLPALAAIRQMPGLRVVGILSHLACADEPTRPVTGQQIDRLRQLLTAMPDPVPASLANSAGLLAHPASHLDWVRPGIMIYGANPFHPVGSARDWGLQPVVSWRSRIIQVREVPANTPHGYGHAFVTQRPSRLAQIPVGYADGYSRCLAGRGHVLIHGQAAPVVGRVCMDLLTADITDLAMAHTGSLVTLLGRDGEAAITAETMATWLQTIPYELFCRLGARIPRHSVA